MPRFVILLHEVPEGHARGTHWDLMLESEGVLHTWALNAEPVAGQCCDAEQLPDHRPAYLTYEGPVSGGRGTVTQWDRGEYLVELETADQRCVRLEGGKGTLRVTLDRREPGSQFWRVSFSAAPTRG
ncbi:MAG: hypothetical protein DWQ37_15765 [Planctomycetota bacterium]|nr:MAG: hypothetical protein DWQ37_15765 [Planctomycetota bacterium]